MRKIFLPPELYDGIKHLSQEDKGSLLDNIYQYNLGLDYNIPDNLKIVFGFFKPFFDKDIERHKQYIITKSENGKKGGRPKMSYENKENSQKAKKAKKAKKATELTGLDILYYSNKEVNNIFKEYIDNRKSKPTVKAIELLKKTLDKYPDDIKIKMIEKSIMNGWTGIFELSGPKQETITTLDEFDRFIKTDRYDEAKKILGIDRFTEMKRDRLRHLPYHK